MKILHILPVDFAECVDPLQISSGGGAQRYAFSLSKELSKRFETKLMIFGKKRKTIKWDTLTIEIYPAFHYLKMFNFNSNSLPSIFSLYSEIRWCDIIHCHQYYTDVTLLASIIGKTLNKKVFVTDQGWKGLNMARFFHPYTLVDRFLIHTKFQTKIFSDNKSSIIYGGINIEQYGYSKNKSNKIIFLGRIMPHKGIEYLINAVDCNTELVIAGRVVNIDYLQYLKDISRCKNVHFLLNESDERIIKELTTSKILVLPSVNRDRYGKYHTLPELLGLVVIEAMACGTPVITSRHQPFPEIINDEIGWMADETRPEDVAELIISILSDKQLLETKGLCGRRYIEENSNWDVVIDKYIKVFNSIAK